MSAPNFAASDDAVERAIARRARENAVAEAYEVISAALNRGDDAMVLDAIRTEHSTLLGKLANTVLTAVAERPHDGRLCDLNDKLSTKAGCLGPQARVSSVRQRFI